MKLTFLGAAGTVTGSKYLIENKHGKRILVDCGLFQGVKENRLRNRDPFSVPPHTISAVILTHAHIDHSGYVPLLVKNGFRGKVYATPGTRDLSEILLPDSARIQEEDAEYANRKGFSKHKPALPLYTEKDARIALKHFVAKEHGHEFEPSHGFKCSFIRNGHIIGSSCVKLFDGEHTIVFSGDLGRDDDLIMRPPEKIKSTDYLVIESTYGDRLHQHKEVVQQLDDLISKAIERGGSIIIPAFSVGRTQALLYCFYKLQQQGKITNIPIYLDSPLSIDATEIMSDHGDELKISADECRGLGEGVHYINKVEDSKRLNERKEPMIIISASGMLTGGRVLHHLKLRASDPRNTIIFTGFQPPGTRGDKILSGATSVTIHGEEVLLRAQVERIENFSAHADQENIVRWLSNFSKTPMKTFITHGEPAGAQSLKGVIEERLGWECEVPAYMDEFKLT